MSIKPLNPHYSMENPATIYDEESLTALQLVGRTTAKVNETVEAFNNLDRETVDRLNTQDNRITKMNDETMPAKVVSEFQKNISNGNFERMVDEYAGNLEARVDNLLGSVQEGTTTMDAEVIDIRTGADNVSYDSAGSAVRGQYKNILDRLGSEASRNLFNKKAIKVDYYLGTEGGESYNNTVDMNVSEFIPVEPNAVYCIFGAFNAFIYNADKIMIKWVDNCFITTPDAKFVRFTVSDENINTAFMVKDFYLSPYTEYGEKIVADNVSTAVNNLNLFNARYLTAGRYINIDGSTSYNPEYFITPLIYGSEGEIFTIKNHFDAAVYNEDYSFSRMVGESFRMENNERFFKVTFHKDHLYHAVIQKRVGFTEEKDGYRHTTICVGSGWVFEKITDALNAITDNNEFNRYTLLLECGNYNETFFTKHYVDIVGVNKHKCVIDYVSDDESDYVNRSTIFGESFTTLRNLTVMTTGSKYPLHCDSDYGFDYHLICENCVFKHNGFKELQVGGTAVGIGLYHGQHIELINCQCVGSNQTGVSSIYCHNQSGTNETNSAYRSLTVKHCILDGASYGIRLQSLEDNDLQDNDCYIIGCVNNAKTKIFKESNAKDSWHVHEV